MNPVFMSNKPTHYVLDYSNIFLERLEQLVKKVFKLNKLLEYVSMLDKRPLVQFNRPIDTILCLFKRHRKDETEALLFTYV